MEHWVTLLAITNSSSSSDSRLAKRPADLKRDQGRKQRWRSERRQQPKPTQRQRHMLFATWPSHNLLCQLHQHSLSKAKWKARGEKFEELQSIGEASRCHYYVDAAHGPHGVCYALQNLRPCPVVPCRRAHVCRLRHCRRSVRSLRLPHPSSRLIAFQSTDSGFSRNEANTDSEAVEVLPRVCA